MTFKEWLKSQENSRINKRKFGDLFDFTKVSNGNDKWMRYETFFEAVSWIIWWIKFYDYEKESPLTKEILEFFEVDGLWNILK